MIHHGILKLLFLAGAVFVASGALSAQELTVKRMECDLMDLSAKKYERRDLNGEPCALVKVQLDGRPFFIDRTGKELR